MIGAFRDRSDDQSITDQAAIVAMYVTPDWRGRGVSSLLMHAILDVLKQVGIRRVNLGVNVEQTAALRLYQRFGFSIVRSDKLLLGDGLVHEDYWMEKML
jgi:GNAT superfamily N-acetyltransferase